MLGRRGYTVRSCLVKSRQVWTGTCSLSHMPNMAPSAGVPSQRQDIESAEAQTIHSALGPNATDARAQPGNEKQCSGKPVHDDQTMHVPSSSAGAPLVFA
jgi:hypothetical protein